MFIEIRHLRSLQAIAHTPSLALAARRLHLTQSALSHQIRALEHHFGISLFHRGCKPLRLTHAGERLVALAEQVLPQIAHAEYELRRLVDGELGRLHITIECHACFEWLIGTLEQYRERWPEVEVDLRLSMSFDAMPPLLRGEIDLVISSDPVDAEGVIFEPLFPYEGRLVVASDHPLADRSYALPQDLQDQTLIVYPVPRGKLDVFQHFLTPANVEPKAVRQVELTAMILQLVASRRGVAVLPDWVLHEATRPGRLCSLPLGPRGLHGMLYAAVRIADRELPFVREFIALAARRRERSP